MGQLSIIESGNLPAVNEAFGKISQNFRPTSNGTGTPWLLFNGKSGRYTFEDSDPEGRPVLIDVVNCQHGYRAWIDKSPDDVFVPITEQKPVRPDAVRDSAGKLEEFNDAYRLAGQFTDGAMELFELTVNSWGGRAAVESLITASRAQHAEGSEYVFPIVVLESTSMNDDYGNYKPVFRIINWMNPAGELENEEDPEPEPKKSRRSRRS